MVNSLTQDTPVVISETADNAAGRGQLDVLKYQRRADIAAGSGQLDVLKQLASPPAGSGQAGQGAAPGQGRVFGLGQRREWPGLVRGAGARHHDQPGDEPGGGREGQADADLPREGA